MNYRSTQSWSRPLAQRCPRLVEKLQPLALAQLPSPVSRLSELEKHLQHPSLFIKRDDKSSDLYGGNKPRKLEFLLGEAKRRGVSTVVTMGGFGSNHLLATALHAKTLGIRTVGVIFPQPMTEQVERNLAADRAAGVELVCIPYKYALPFYVASTLARIRMREKKSPLLIAGGGSSALGSLGFVNAGLELAAQVAAGLLPEPDEIFLPFGTGGTAAGLAVGLCLAGLRSTVVAVRVIDRLLANRPRLMAKTRVIARRCGRFGDDLSWPDHPGRNLRIEHDYIGPGYGHPTPSAQQAVDQFATLEQVNLELTYTGKAAAAFLDRAKNNKNTLLFWHTFSSAEIGSLVRAGRESV